jgi:transcriptional regulator with XRE-family HTH domain
VPLFLLVTLEIILFMPRQKRRLNRIKIVLLENETTNLKLAEELGVSKTTVSKWCTNDNQPSVETLFRIAEILGVDVCELLITKSKKPKNSQ